MLSAGHHVRLNVGFVIISAVICLQACVFFVYGAVGLIPVSLFASLGLLFIPAIFISLFTRVPIQTRHIQKTPVSLPYISLLIPLYREADIMAQMQQSLAHINYPANRLEALILVEPDDLETQSAFHTIDWADFVRLIVLPDGTPRTKPRALNCGLSCASGEIIGVLDAEDVVHPDQLLDAATQFSYHDDSLGAVQAPLVIRPQSARLMHHLFALEYLIQFHFILPALIFLRMPIPLSGTSNYFRRAALIKTLGWDSYNLTEDADLGLRLYRNGYHIRLLTRPTYECAPDTWRDWFFQRTRWFTGHLQTLLVHARCPRAIIKDIGTLRVIAIFGILVSRLLYGPTHSALLIFALSDPHMMSTSLIHSFSGQIAILIYLAMTICVVLTTRVEHILALITIIPALALYWMLHIFPLGLAVVHILKRNHVWYKTPHRPHHNWHNDQTPPRLDRPARP